MPRKDGELAAGQSHPTSPNHICRKQPIVEDAAVARIHSREDRKIGARFAHRLHDPVLVLAPRRLDVFAGLTVTESRPPIETSCCRRLYVTPA